MVIVWLYVTGFSVWYFLLGFNMLKQNRWILRPGPFFRVVWVSFFLWIPMTITVIRNKFKRTENISHGNF